MDWVGLYCTTIGTVLVSVLFLFRLVDDVPTGWASKRAVVFFGVDRWRGLALSRAERGIEEDTHIQLLQDLISLFYYRNRAI
jgi:hypothetical protein